MVETAAVVSQTNSIGNGLYRSWFPDSIPRRKIVRDVSAMLDMTSD